MAASFSVLNMGAIAMYAAVAVSCALASRSAVRDRRGTGDIGSWVALGLFFCLLIWMRAFQVEKGLESFLRDSLVAGGEYRLRRDFQAPFAAAAIVVIAAISVFVVRSVLNARMRRSARLLRWARFGAVAMLGLIVLRLISFHSIDVLLYGTPHLNFIIDAGAALLVGWAAIRYRASATHEARSTARSKR